MVRVDGVVGVDGLVGVVGVVRAVRGQICKCHLEEMMMMTR